MAQPRAAASPGFPALSFGTLLSPESQRPPRQKRPPPALQRGHGTAVCGDTDLAEPAAGPRVGLGWLAARGQIIVFPLSNRTAMGPAVQSPATHLSELG